MCPQEGGEIGVMALHGRLAIEAFKSSNALAFSPCATANRKALAMGREGESANRPDLPSRRGRSSQPAEVRAKASVRKICEWGGRLLARVLKRPAESSNNDD